VTCQAAAPGQIDVVGSQQECLAYRDREQGSSPALRPNTQKLSLSFSAGCSVTTPPETSLRAQPAVSNSAASAAKAKLAEFTIAVFSVLSEQIEANLRHLI
jgi:hypothetical protein